MISRDLTKTWNGQSVQKQKLENRSSLPSNVRPSTRPGLKSRTSFHFQETLKEETEPKPTQNYRILMRQSSKTALTRRVTVTSKSRSALIRRTTYTSIQNIDDATRKPNLSRRTTFSYPSKAKVAVGRKPSNVSQKRLQRRSSEPFLLDPLTLQNKWNRKCSTTSRANGRRRVSTTATLPTSSKQKLQALAKDELLASLNVPLSRPDLTISSPVEKRSEILQESIEQKLQYEKERKEKKRLLIIEEILETEKNYISCLETLNIVFRTQLENSNIITDKDLISLFPSHLSEIKISHTWFMQELEDRMKHEDWRGIIGDIFAKMTSASANLLEIYTCYVNAFPKSISTLSKCTRSSHKFRKFLEDCYENPLVERLDLPSFLLSPVQRLPRYILLLRELLKYTDEEHPDHYFIGTAMQEMEALISSLNDSIQNSMEFLSASEGRRKKMSRQFTNKKRKQRSSQISRCQKKMIPLNETKSTDGDQGYCSFSERKDESPEDETAQQGNQRPSVWRIGDAKRSMSMVSACSEDIRNNSTANLIIRRKPEFGRNSDRRKSWRRSLGAVFSQIWSKDESNRENNLRRESNAGFLSQASNETEERDDINPLQSKSEVNMTSGSNTRKMSTVRRKVAVSHPKSSNESNETEKLRQMINLENNSLPEEDNSPDSTVSVEISKSMNSSLASIDRLERCNSQSSFVSATSPQMFIRDKIRSSAGPSFKSLFNKNKLTQKTLSWDEVNVDRTDGFTNQPEKKQKRYSISIRRPKLSKQDETLSIDHSFSCKSLNKERESTSSNETISSHTSSRSNINKENYSNNTSSDSNNNDNKGAKEKRHKFMKSLRSFVSKK